MQWYLIVPSALAVLFAAGGTAALRTGWIPPFQRRRVQRPRLFGWAQLVLAAAFAAQTAGYLLGDREARHAAGIVTLLALLCGLILAVAAQLSRENR
ncbi:MULTISPECIES: hypothetical protein [Streptomyces]|uniref:Uncharacterized protein n=1 Tax=Streptomyces venezuelae (strain ATCC 10712 / CBS 650.69 / DSM 40230 / JCM 4526 / NBRC 13096 / PD 04745) TaxID=953739 RepID=F2R733_STRVP|nr:hypothetical protein [Streptomyces venezuelae]APE19905.1 hypothetical protein vnz_02080 [Streptomyces venezuelae]QER97313.1 hypothetical protein DEJ43_02105 [Streptomyces venezuelae ATCC 10712]CCA53725.1 hypothetical protein SVEN_0438 [Streptomyces venezuelae ATCC 10712]